MKKAFITGIGGQDGSYLAEHLLNLNYEVWGIIRRNSVPENQESRINHLQHNKNLHCVYGDLLDTNSIEKILMECQPDEIYNLAAQSHVRISFDIPQLTVQTNALAVLNLLDSYRKICPNAKFYQASSSEMFGESIDKDGYQRETTPFKPVSPYGCSKVFAFNICKNYRKSYNLPIYNGILFNHESKRRGSNFVTNKIIKGAILIKYGKQKQLELGNLDSYRDWGHSKDYVKAMHKILQQDKEMDLVISTGDTRSVRDLCKIVFNKLNLDYTKYVIQNEKYLRPQELPYLKGDSQKAREILNWEPEISFEDMINEMMEHWENILKS